MNKTRKISIIMIIAVLAMFYCKDNATNYVPIIGVYGNIYPDHPDSSGITGKFTITNCPGVPSLAINDVSYDAYFNDNVFTFHPNDINGFPGEQLSINLAYAAENKEHSEVSIDIVYPEEFEVESIYNSIDTIRSGQDYIVDWSNSVGADYYSVKINFHYAYYDTTNTYRAKIINIDTLVTESEIVLPNTTLFPDTDNIVTIIDSDGTLNLYAISGPMLPGDVGNVRGDGFGIVNARSRNFNYDLIVVSE